MSEGIDKVQSNTTTPQNQTDAEDQSKATISEQGYFVNPDGSISSKSEGAGEDTQTAWDSK